jgi:TP901 family phage tail tape measure protein
VADITKAVEIIFGVVDNTGSGLSSVGAGISNFADQAQSAISPLNKMADAVKLTDTAIVALGLAFGGAALNAAGQFNGKIAEVGTLFSGTTEEVDGFRTSVEKYASDSTKSLDDITGALYTAVSAGIAWSDAVGFVSTAEQLAVAGQSDLTSSTNVLIGSMNAYGAAADEAGKYSDILMQTVLLGQTTLPELAQSLAMVTSTAAAANIPFADLGAAVAALTAAGVPTSQAMTGIQAAISNIIKPTKEAQETAAGLGLKFDATALASKGFDGVLKEVYASTGGNVEVMAKLFGSMEGLKTATALGADKAGVYAKALDAMANSAGSTAKAFEVLSKQWEAQWQIMANNFDLFMTKTGTKLLEGGEFAGLITKMTDIMKSVNFSIDAGAFDDVFETLRGLAARLSDFMAGIAKNLPAALDMVDFSKFNSALVNLANSLGGMFKGVDLTTPKGLAEAIQLVVNSIANLLNQGAGIAQVWANLIEKALPLVKIFSDMSQESATASGKLLGLGDVLKVLLPGLGALGSAIGSVGSGLELLAGASLLKTVTGMGSMSTAAGVAGTAAAALATALGPGVLLGATGAAGYAVGTVLNTAINTAVKSLTGSGSLGGLIYDLTHDTDELAKAAPVGADGLKKIGDAASDAADPTKRLRDEVMELRSAATDTSKFITGYSDALVTAGIAAGEARLKTEFLAQAQKTLKDPTLENKTALNELAATYKDTATWAGHTADASKTIKTAYEQLYPVVAANNDRLKTSAGVMEELGKKTDLTNKDLLELAKLTKDAEVKLAALASNERIKNIEANVSLNIANLEANTKIATALIEGISNTITSTGDVLGGLFGQFKDFNSMGFSQKWKITEQIDKENKLRQDAFDLQKRLTYAQIEMMQAQTDALVNGDSLIKIDGSGLAPHLEAFMWEVLKAVQVKVNRDGLKLLLGV